MLAAKELKRNVLINHRELLSCKIYRIEIDSHIPIVKNVKKFDLNKMDTMIFKYE